MITPEQINKLETLANERGGGAQCIHYVITLLRRGEEAHAEHIAKLEHDKYYFWKDIDSLIKEMFPSMKRD